MRDPKSRIGRIERVQVQNYVSSVGHALGSLRGERIFIRWGAKGVPNEGLVRICEDIPALQKLVGKYITSRVPDDFQGSDPQSYVFLGLWEASFGEPSGLRDIHEIYDPGFVPRTCLFEKRSGWLLQRNIGGRRSGYVDPDPAEAILSLPYRPEYARVLFASADAYAQIFDEIKRMRFTPIFLEPKTREAADSLSLPQSCI